MAMTGGCFIVANLFAPPRLVPPAAPAAAEALATEAAAQREAPRGFLLGKMVKSHAKSPFFIDLRMKNGHLV